MNAQCHSVDIAISMYLKKCVDCQELHILRLLGVI